MTRKFLSRRVIHLFVLFLALGAQLPCPHAANAAVAARELPPPAVTPAGPAPLASGVASSAPEDSRSLNGEWMRSGGARLYWNTLMYPRQIRMGGARFVDPAAMPELLAPAKSAKKQRAASGSKSRASSKAPVAASDAPARTSAKPANSTAKPMPPQAPAAPALSLPAQPSQPTITAPVTPGGAEAAPGATPNPLPNSTSGAVSGFGPGGLGSLSNVAIQ
ncbi:MAG: hypothetical protein LBO64_07160 [Desulfovibrio sp.]|nr:hypothetical protein [Desulfovibrio sp.]